MSVLALTIAAGPVWAGTVHQVAISGSAFVPATLTITVGDTVTWTNQDAVAHTATSTSGAWDSGNLAQGQSYSLTFSGTGTFDYLCTPHPEMTGRIVVQAAPLPQPTPIATTVPNVATAEWSGITAAGAILLLLALAAVITGLARRRRA